MKTFEQTKRWSYKGEGWGLTHDDTRLIMSDGTAQLRFIDPATLKETGRITVRDAGGPVERLNELEYVKGEIFANVWQTDRIARISPKDGRVTGWIDLSGLLPPAERRAGADVLNGIAYDAAGDRLFVTGKLWPRVFEIKTGQARGDSALGLIRRTPSAGRAAIPRHARRARLHLLRVDESTGGSSLRIRDDAVDEEHAAAA